MISLNKRVWGALCLILALFVQSSHASAGQKNIPLPPLAPTFVAAQAIDGIDQYPAPLPVPPYQFTDEAGNPVSVTDFRGRYILLNIWATWCAPCVRELPHLVELQKRFDSSQFEVVAVSVDRAPSLAINFLKKPEFQSIVPYMDIKSQAMTVLGVQGLPTSLLIDPAGQVLLRGVGGIPWSMSPYVDLIINALPPSSPSSPSSKI